MDERAEPLTMYGATSEAGRLDWARVDEQLSAAGGYWVAVAHQGRSHPRPVWGVWHDVRLHLSVGSPTLRAALATRSPVAVHLGSINDVVIVEGVVVGETDSGDVLDHYNTKYDWNYTVEEYGTLTTIAPRKVMAWRSDGWAGRDGFQATSRWLFDQPG